MISNSIPFDFNICLFFVVSFRRKLGTLFIATKVLPTQTEECEDAGDHPDLPRDSHADN